MAEITNISFDLSRRMVEKSSQVTRDRIEKSGLSQTPGWTFSSRFDAIGPIPAPQMYPATVELYRQGAEPKDVFLLESGMAKLVRIESEGRELIIDLRFPGSLMGSFSAILKRAYPLTAITLVNSQLRRIPAKLFRQLIETDVEFSMHIHQLQSEQAFAHVLRVESLSCFTARQRLEQLLWQLTFIQGFTRETKDLWLSIPLRYWEVAGLIVVSPAYLSRLFGELEREGILLRKKGRLIICNPQRLWHHES